MAEAALPADEDRRLSALRATELLDTASEERFDRITRLATERLGTPISLVTLVDADRQWFKSCIGLPIRETPRDQAFCAHALLGSGPLIVPDAHADPRFADNPLVTGEPYIRFYAGAPIALASGERVGTLCVIDRVPREMPDADVRALSDLARLVELELNAADTSVALEMAREHEQRLRTVTTWLSEGVALVDPGRRIRFANPAFARFVGQALPDLDGRLLADVLRDAEEPREWIEHCVTAALREEPVEPYRAQLERPDGGRSCVDVRFTPAPGAADMNVLVTCTDTSAREALEQLRSRFISSVSHELRTPLTSVRGYLQALLLDEAGPLNEEQREFAEIAWRNAGALEGLVADLLLVSRLEEASTTPELESVAIDLVLQELADGRRDAADMRGISLEVRAEPLTLPADKPKLERALVGLIDNAIRFGPASGTVTIKAGRAAGEAVIEVTDEGTGMDAKEAEELSRPFARGARADGLAGAGVGLGIARGVATLHGGRLEVVSAPGGGACVRMRLPLAPQE